jgi:hypothetical protein
MTRSIVALVALIAAAAVPLARPARACAMYLEPPRVEVVVGQPVQSQPVGAVQPVVEPTGTELQRAMALIDAVGLIPEATRAPNSAPPPTPEVDPTPTGAETAGIAKASPPMAQAPTH